MHKISETAAAIFGFNFIINFHFGGATSTIFSLNFIINFPLLRCHTLLQGLLTACRHYSLNSVEYSLTLPCLKTALSKRAAALTVAEAIVKARVVHIMYILSSDCCDGVLRSDPVSQSLSSL